MNLKKELKSCSGKSQIFEPKHWHLAIHLTKSIKYEWTNNYSNGCLVYKGICRVGTYFHDENICRFSQGKAESMFYCQCGVCIMYLRMNEIIFNYAMEELFIHQSLVMPHNDCIYCYLFIKILYFWPFKFISIVRAKLYKLYQ
jgi:hypothetical protein